MSAGITELTRGYRVIAVDRVTAEPHPVVVPTLAEAESIRDAELERLVEMGAPSFDIASLLDHGDGGRFASAAIARRRAPLQKRLRR